MKSLLGFFGVVALLAIICGVFALFVPLESDTQTCNTAVCAGATTKDYHLAKGEMQAYQDAKKCIDAHQTTCSATTVRLFL